MGALILLGFLLVQQPEVHWLLWVVYFMMWVSYASGLQERWDVRAFMHNHANEEDYKYWEKSPFSSPRGAARRAKKK
jgi:hypothetical protein